MSDHFLPVELDAESVTIIEDGSGWGITIQTESYGELYCWLDYPDGLFDQMMDEGILGCEDGELVTTNEY